MKAKLYVETTVISLLVARRSKDPETSRQQAITRAWWRQRAKWELFSSTAVRDEASLGDPKEAYKRLVVLHTMTPLAATPTAEKIADGLLTRGILPKKAKFDAAHLGIAAAHHLDVLLSWNCKHLANTTILRQIYQWAAFQGYNIPVVCTPEELLRSSI